MVTKSMTDSKGVLATVIAMSALSMTTTINTSTIMYTPPVIMGEVMQESIGTNTISTIKYDEKTQTMYEQAKNCFGGEMRDFTKEESEIYEQALEKIYKPIGVNIFDLC